LPLRVIARRNDEAIQEIKLNLWIATLHCVPLAMTAAFQKAKTYNEQPQKA
jgi:hypothetical protein